MSDFAARLTAVADAVERELERLLSDQPTPGEVARPPRLLAAMRHGALAGGKRLRPFLLIETADLFGVGGEGALRAACALELVHCYSLVHDDLPAMDDDDLRRGKPTVHKAFDDATAILAGDSLRTLAFDVMGDEPTHADPTVRAALVVGLARAAGLTDPAIELRDGAVVSGPDLSVTVNGVKFPNPFVIGSGPPGTNYAVMKKAFDEGWGGVICKTLSLDSKKVVNVTPRYAKLRDSAGAVVGWENIELISDRPFETMLAEMKRLREEYPGRVLIASIMEEYSKNAWEEIVGRCEEVGVDAFELNFSCPHGMPERKMGMAMGQDCELLGEVCGWVNGVANVPVWAKMTPNVTDITAPAKVALEAGCEGIAAINTIQVCLLSV